MESSSIGGGRCERGGPGDPIENPVWTFGDVLLVSLGGVVFFLLLGIPTILMFASVPLLEAGRSPDLTATVAGIIAQTLTYIAVLVLIGRVVRTRGTSLHQYLSTLAALRWHPDRNTVPFAAAGVWWAGLGALTSLSLPLPPGWPLR